MKSIVTIDNAKDLPTVNHHFFPDFLSFPVRKHNVKHNFHLLCMITMYKKGIRTTKNVL